MSRNYILSASNNNIVEQIRETVSNFGYCIVRGLNLGNFDETERNQKLFDFLSQLETPAKSPTNFHQPPYDQTA